jgi:hypothetical protein
MFGFTRLAELMNCRFYSFLFCWFYFDSSEDSDSSESMLWTVSAAYWLIYGLLTSSNRTRLTKTGSFPYLKLLGNEKEVFARPWNDGRF